MGFDILGFASKMIAKHQQQIHANSNKPYFFRVMDPKLNKQKQNITLSHFAKTEESAILLSWSLELATTE